MGACVFLSQQVCKRLTAGAVNGFSPIDGLTDTNALGNLNLLLAQHTNQQTSKSRNGIIYRLSLSLCILQTTTIQQPNNTTVSSVFLCSCPSSLCYFLVFVTLNDEDNANVGIHRVGQKCEERPNTGFIPFHNRETVSHEHSPLPASKQATSSKLHQDDKQPTLQQSNTIYL